MPQKIVLIATLALTLSAGVIIGVDSREQGDLERAMEFQHLVGGLGFGPAVDLASCPNSFDPRVSGHCLHDFGPIPGGGYFCPEHACSIFYYRGLDSMP
ncbi:MAG TPA: hypothetical protein VG099_19660 [Gemmataceae bacterium]|jgi:hypothetical protein|nr:hypothetical protein [Gemmataceae bacterium]